MISTSFSETDAGIESAELKSLSELKSSRFRYSGDRSCKVASQEDDAGQHAQC